MDDTLQEMLAHDDCVCDEHSLCLYHEDVAPQMFALLRTDRDKLAALLTEVYEREIEPELEPDVPCHWDHHRVCQTHWRSPPGEESVPGVGERPGPEEKCGFYDLADRIRAALDEQSRATDHGDDDD